MDPKKRQECRPRHNPVQWFYLVAAVVTLAVFAGGTQIHGQTGRVLMMAKVTDYAKAYTNMGRRQLEGGNYLRAVRLLNSAIAKGADAEAFKLRGEAYVRVGKFDRALSDLNHYVSTQPKDPSGYILRGWLHNLAEDHSRAYQDYQRALQLEPSQAEALLGRGIASVGLENYEQAIQDFENVLKLQPRNQDALVDLGLARMLSQSNKKALELLKKARETETDDAWKERLGQWIGALQQRLDNPMNKVPEQASTESGEQIRALPLTESDPAEPLNSGEPPDQAATRKATEAGSSIPKDSAMERSQTSQTSQQSLMERLRSSDLYGEPSEAIKKLSGHWETTYLGARIGLDVKHRGGKRIYGVLRIRDPMGKEDSYHFTGTFERGNVYAYHHSGHLFRGRLTSTGRLVGSLRMKNGRTVRVDLTAR